MFTSKVFRLLGCNYKRVMFYVIISIFSNLHKIKLLFLPSSIFRGQTCVILKKLNYRTLE